MQKNRKYECPFLGAFFCLLALSSCGFIDTFKESQIPDVSSSVYKKIGSSTMNLSGAANRRTELYMFVYNMNDTAVSFDSYKEIFKGGGGRSAYCSENDDIYDADNFELNEHSISFDKKNLTYPFISSSCGLSLEQIRRAYTHFPEHFLERAVSSKEPYNRTKNKAASKIGDRSAFYTITKNRFTDSEKIKVINAVCVYSNDVCQVFVENGCFDSTTTDRDYTTGNSIKVTEQGARKIANKFKSIYGAETGLLGSVNLDEFDYADIIETSEKMTILLSNLGKSESGEITLGYFYPGDLYCDFDVKYKGNEIDDFSNQRQMFTLNVAGFSEDYGADLMYSTLGHEFNHMINFINKVVKHQTEFDTWFTEMLSAIAEDFVPDFLGIENTVKYKRIPYFNMSPYSGMLDWNEAGNALYAYGFAYTFGAYLVRNYGGAKIIYEMANNTFYGKEAINAALKSCGYNENYEAVFQKFGLIMANADGRDMESPTLNKEIVDLLGTYTYRFPAIDLCDCAEESQNDRGPYFFTIENNHIYFPEKIYANGFYATYLGYAKDWNYSLAFSPPSSSSGITAYVYVKNRD